MYYLRTSNNYTIYNMNYQPNLCVFNNGRSTCKKIYEIIKALDFGKIKYVERDDDYVYVSIAFWNTLLTTATRMKLQQGKPLLLYYSENECWKVYSYEHRFKEYEERKRLEKKESQMKEAAVCKERKEKAAAVRKERKEKAAALRREQQLDKELKQKSMSEKTYDSDKPVIQFVSLLDYGNVAETYPAIKARAKKMFDRLKNKQ